jgi:thymidine kinase
MSEILCNKQKYTGYIKLHLGSMFSGKTSTLIEEYIRYSIGNKKCLMIKHEYDIRFSNTQVTTHDNKYNISDNINGDIIKENEIHTTKIANNIDLNTFKCQLLFQADEIIMNNNYDAIFIDEIQFFEDSYIFCDKWANNGLIIHASGLNGTYERKEFKSIAKLIPLVEYIQQKTAICRETGNEASFTTRTSKDKEIIVIAGIDKYKPTDRQTYFNELDFDDKVKYEYELFYDFKNIYCKSKNIQINIDKNKLIDFIIQKITNNKINFNYIKMIELFSC